MHRTRGTAQRDQNQYFGADMGGRHGANDSLFAVIDLGTNNCRLMIAARSGSGFRVVDSVNRTVRLGEGLHKTGALSESAMDRTVEVLKDCVSRIDRRYFCRVRAIATEACRRASNGKAFLDRVLQETGLKIDIISAREEAELALESCSALLHQSTDRGTRNRGLLFDIGGGSTEIAWIRVDNARRSNDLVGYVSLPVGVITLAEEFRGAIFHPDGYESMVRHVAQRLRSFEAVHCIGREVDRDSVCLLGTSGTVTTLASVAFGLPRYSRAAIDGVTMEASEALSSIRYLEELGAEGLREHPCIGKERADYVLPGCAIFEAIHRVWPVKDVVVADRGLRDGMLTRMLRDNNSRRAIQAVSSRRPGFGPSAFPTGAHLT